MKFSSVPRQAVSIAICTYKRPQLLKECLESVINQNTVHDFEVVVIDNDKLGSARQIVENINTNGINIKYFIEPQQGLSNARNLAVSKCQFDLVLFIDDDEHAHAKWIDNMIYCLDCFGADAVLGKVIYRVPSVYPNYIVNSKYFQRRQRISGELAVENDGYCGNTLIKKALLTNREIPFKSEFNKTGGEDCEFFNYLLKDKRKVVFSNEGVIYETQDEKRLTIGWYFKRGYRSGWLHSKKTVEGRGNIRSVIPILKSVLGGIILALYFSLRMVFNFNHYFLMFLFKSSNQIGKVGFFFGFRVDEYSETKDI